MKKAQNILHAKGIKLRTYGPGERSTTCRFGSGGSIQRFCCTACRLDFHKERQRSERRGVYAGPTTRRARGQPAKTETLPRASAVAALGPWETWVLNIAGCDRTEFVVALNEGEGAGTRVETWPPEVRTFIEHYARCGLSHSAAGRKPLGQTDPQRARDHRGSAQV